MASQISKAGESCLMPKIASTHNLRLAWLKVKEAKDSPGLDRVNLRMFARDLEENLVRIQKLLLRDWYIPLPARGVQIPKESGGTRQLGIFTIEDRLVQRAFLNVLEPIFEEDFLPQSFGYRRGKSVQQVAEEILDYRDQGLEWVVDADITRFFDSTRCITPLLYVIMGFV
ncbi:RNA-directed DNA polymerase [Candidatus Hakubella thermalkaliphila]|uniref:RNA-directed DNA polymerase n=1 Tax=Candidatus Hakubella thermalkaliphila TaxID=2754717 RepID=A0A6V8NMH7_9ACTN|nr:reverse transcriptase domain-containing protein [Candidatus Hakubella thermalkaliphila]GFP19696.1 RNA-directed DNA polymerase [Candidatus Hakubella thermalkaliphila]GFP24201.1 RNA-directed DNA polymerase [Candidatus Hakubella thermalkaliphila]GFP29870.1 RNA-directed DNA polymerase [Candidatus Hakubella thermalkaliphila]GFP39928.1 RNA-directed DNA polymerase [Candidatus Hakubella thermalkaliphila]